MNINEKKKRCLLHTWSYKIVPNGQIHPFTGVGLQRNDRVCKDCGLTQTEVAQFPVEKHRKLTKFTGCVPTQSWVPIALGTFVDKMTMRWLAISK
jgi:hypothetical protein